MRQGGGLEAALQPAVVGVGIGPLAAGRAGYGCYAMAGHDLMVRHDGKIDTELKLKLKLI